MKIRTIEVDDDTAAALTQRAAERGVSVPESGMTNKNGEWVIEGYGVDPDIEVEREPKALIEGHDQQLERAVSEMMNKLKGREVKLPPKPAGPVKTPK